MRKVTLEYVAKKYGCTIPNIWHLEKCSEETIKLESLRKYAKALGYELVIELRQLPSIEEN
jgi:hypothetical protein